MTLPVLIGDCSGVSKTRLERARAHRRDLIYKPEKTTLTTHNPPHQKKKKKKPVEATK